LNKKNIEYKTITFDTDINIVINIVMWY